jgi:hypothetical protein
LNVRAQLVIGFVKQHIVELPPINRFSTTAALAKVPFLRFTQLVKVSGIHFKTAQESSMAQPFGNKNDSSSILSNGPGVSDCDEENRV